MRDSQAKGYYVFADYVTAIIAWGIVAVLRWQLLYYLGYSYTKEWEGFRALDSHFYEKWFVWVPILTVSLSFFFGAYEKAPFLKSRVREVFGTLSQTFAISLLLYFLTLLKEYAAYWQGIMVFICLWLIFFLVVSCGRILVLQFFKSQIQKGKIALNAVIIGSGNQALGLITALSKDNLRSGIHCLGYVSFEGKNDYSNVMDSQFCIGKIAELPSLITNNNIRCVILAPEDALSHQEQLRHLALLSCTPTDLLIVPQEADYLSGRIHTEDILSIPLVRINPSLMPVWQRHSKRIFDFFISLFGLLIGAPLLIYVAIRTRLSSQGPILFKQQRVGKNGRLFYILKFRSMFLNAEKEGPQLSRDGDPRITAWGRIMRKWRLDELPQLWNILKGDMSLVGPRPERPYFVELLSKEVSYYKVLLQMQPGLTSWGMVQFGYASDLAEMKERLKYDLVYLDNASLLVDLKILIYTIRILFLGKGK